MNYYLGNSMKLVIAANLIAMSSVVMSNENVSQESSDKQIETNDFQSTSAPPSNRILTSPGDLTSQQRSDLGIRVGEAAGAGGHPYTTKRASAKNSSSPTDLFPWSAVGKLYMSFGSNNFVCSATIIRRGILVTAAHCVHNFGQEGDGFADSIEFEPARYESERPFGTWTASQWWIPKAYYDGTDTCSSGAPGVVCENDIAVIVIESKYGEYVGEAAGMYDFNDGENNDGYGYVNFLGKEAVQITQLGYPSMNYDGDKMVRTDSLGYKSDPNNLIFGSSQTGGSSGASLIVNFGTPTSHIGSEPADNESNQVIGTTSWGYVDDSVKIQGGSRFSTNSIYTVKSNIQSLVDDACNANVGSCD